MTEALVNINAGTTTVGNEEKVDSESLTPNRPYNSSFVSHLCHHLVLGIMAISHGHLQTPFNFQSEFRSWVIGNKVMPEVFKIILHEAIPPTRSYKR